MDGDRMGAILSGEDEAGREEACEEGEKVRLVA